MRYWFLLNYVLYKWYSKRDHTPIIYTVLLAPTLLYVNILTISLGVSYISYLKINVPKIIFQISGLLLALINAIILCRKNNYIKIFDRFDTNPKIYKGASSIVIIYIIFTVLLFFLVLLLFDIKNNSHL